MSGGGGNENAESPMVLKGFSKNNIEFPGVIKKKSCGILVFKP